jgi:hypothetical protein
MWKSLHARVACAAALTTAFAAEALAFGPRPKGVPEIDGPAGVAAIALLVSVGIVAYNRMRR